MKHEIIFLDTKETEKFLDKEIYNPTCNNWFHEPFMFEFMKEPLKTHNFNLELKSFENIDKNKSWFIDMPMFPYTWDNLIRTTEKNLFDCIPSYVLEECINGNAYMVFNNQNETDTNLIFEHFYKIYNKNPIVPLKKILFLSPSKYAKNQYMTWADEKRIAKENRFHVVYGNHIDLRFNEGDINFWEQAVEIEKSKVFLSLNRAIRPQRIFLVAALCELGLLDKGNVSLWYNGTKEEFFNELTTRREFFSYSDQGKLLYDLIWSGMNKIVDQLPLYIDIKNNLVNPAGFSSSSREMYKETYFNLTSTTFFFDWQEPCHGWNEKEWKPILAQQPFILFSRPGALQAMKDFGIVTFSKYIDESYDLIKDDVARFWVILNELQRLCKLSKEELDKIINEIQHILKYNFEYTKNKRWDNIFYTGGLKDFIGFL